MDTLQSIHMECGITLENHPIEQFKIRSIVMHHSGQQNTKFPCRFHLQLCDNSVIKKKTKIQTVVLHLKNVVLRNLWTCLGIYMSALEAFCLAYAHGLFTLFLGLITIKEAHDIEARLNEVEKLLKTIINMPWKYSRSEVVLTFFERSPLDQVLKNDNVHKIQPSFQSPVKISEIMRSNGFCLANTETIVIDHSIPNGKEKHLDVDSAEHLFESVSDFTSELEDSDDPTAYVTNLTYYHLVPFETDILD
uniref:PX domain containing 1 n=41 Tax=Neognathae TaxID=8825 RepID=A0A803Y8K9_MELGA